MDPSVTFYHNRQEHEGSAYTLQIKALGEIWQMAIYTHRSLRKPQAEPLFPDLTDSQCFNEQFDSQIKDLQRVISQEGAGGWIVITVRKGEKDQFHIYPAGGGKPIPRNLVVLEPGYSWQSRTFPVDGKLELAQGSHVLIPVDETAQDHLISFLEHLRWYTPDLESLVIHALRRPTLDARVARLEQKLGEAARQDPLRNPGAGRWAKTRWRLAAGAGWLGARGGVLGTLLIVALLALNAGLLWEVRQRLPEPEERAEAKPEEGSEVNSEQTAESGAEGGEAVASAEQGNDVVSAEVKRLVQIVRDGGGGGPDFQTLWTTHFAEVPQIRNVKQWTAEEARSMLRNEYLAWGVIKAAVLASAATAEDTTFLNGWKEWTATKELLRNRALEEIDPEVRRLLGAIACMGEVNTGFSQTGIKATKSGDRTFPALPFVDVSCDDLTLDTALPGLQKLNQDLENRLNGAQD